MIRVKHTPCFIRKTLIILASAVVFHFSSLYGSPAYPELIQFTQPDGSRITIRMMGDEYVRWAETEDYYTLLYNSEGFLEYAVLDSKGDLIPSGIIATNTDKRNKSERRLLLQTPKSLRYGSYQIEVLTSLRQQQLRNDKAFVPTGNKRLIMILVAYTDVPFTRTQAEFVNLMNQAGYNLGGAQGSVKDFFLENSYGTFEVTTDVAGPYTLSQNRAYYGANVSGFDVRPREMVTEAVNLANPDVNFADYDNDGDGTVDGVYVIYAGYGEEAGGGANCIWAHAWSIPTVNLDGVNINRYSCSSELRGNSGTNIATIGVICHEFGHVCGAPDYYDTNYATDGQYDGTGYWDLMAAGSWNGINAAGDCPAHANGYQKWLYGWANPTLLNVQQQVTLRNSASFDDFCYFTTTTAGEFFYCENRQLVGFDRAIPGHGMIIYHVDEPFIATAGNAINAGSHQGMYPKCANAAGNPPTVYGNINSGGCPYPGTGNRTSFTDATTPHARSWAGNNTVKPLTNIVENAGEITFCFISCAPGDPINFIASPISDSQIDLGWTLNSGGDPVLIASNSNTTFGTPVDGTVYSAGQSIPGGGTVVYYGTNTSFNHSALSANTTYYYKAWSSLPGNNYTPGVTANATTLCAPISTFPYTQGFENGGNMPSCWTEETVNGGLNWIFRAGSGSGSPAAARTGSYNANFFEGAYGTVNVSKLIAPCFDINALNSPELTFWYTNRFWSPDQDILRIYYKTSAAGAWTSLATYNTNVSAWTQVTLALPNKSTDYWIAFEATENYAYGICIDDVVVYDASPLPVELTHFSADCSNSDIMVKWTTASETNSDYFLIETSTDGELFTTHGSINAAGNSNTEIIYTYPLEHIGHAFIRLIQADRNGKMSVYGPVLSNCIQHNSNISVFPTITEDFSTIVFENNTGVFSVELINTCGISEQLFDNISVSGYTEFPFSLIGKSPGLYLLRVTEINSQHTSTFKLILE